MQCLRSFHTVEWTIEGVEAARMLRKGQLKKISGGNVAGQAEFVKSVIGVAA